LQTTNKKIKILHIITGLGLGGAEKVVLDLTTHLIQNSYDCTVATINNEVDRIGQFKANNINLIIGGAEKKSSTVLKSFHQILRFVKKERINLIHAHLFHAFRNIDLILHQNNSRSFTKKNYRVIPNGVVIPTTFTRESTFKKFIFLSVGNLREEKNHLLLVDTAKKLVAANINNFEIQIAGEGKIRSEIETEIKRYHLENYVKLLGRQLNVLPLYKNANAFVLPSKWEGMPLSVLEAASYRLPVICTPVGSLTEIINEENGWLVTENKFHIAMKEVLQNYSQALQKANKLNLWVAENYSQQKLFKQYKKVYEELLKS